MQFSDVWKGYYNYDLKLCDITSEMNYYLPDCFLLTNIITKNSKFILSETAVSLLRHPEYCVYASATTSTTRNIEKLETMFNKVSLKERQKIKTETLVNVDGISMSESLKQEQSDGSDAVSEYIVVTIIASLGGKIKLGEKGKIEDTQTLCESLKRIGMVRMEDVYAVEVLWTPQEETDTLTTEEILSDFPELSPIL